MSTAVLYEQRGHAAWITLNQPERHNALSAPLCEGLEAALDRANGEDSVRMIVLTGAGRSFCSGADLKSSGGGAVGSHKDDVPPFVPAIRKLWDCPKPLIGRIQGGAYGGGLGLVAVCDFAIAVDRVRLAFTEVRLGLSPSIISVFVMRKIALAYATRYFLSGESMTAAQAQEIGLVYQAVGVDELDGAVQALCDQLLLCGPKALQEVKQLLRTVPTLSVQDGLAWAAEKNIALFNSPEGQEGMAAFAAKRPAAWLPDGK